ncbi:uncharacterized protein M421DRAFT_417308 [Didymella exigua CBS 183.55]|uniref:Uncharacterized protein n=1 Tax=Didymella exigua CBS 183.55 TaxID=1150837 RepID=A0A6A5RUL4_9PLEO|nr:uncharacterized protein M421DRAFT_417308 [Didymella exigua CBS 183.55]KAF1931542.1 hypothetical protein M421DRAFT_417308 [Didymella exigua CBS 183.55]
MAGFAEPDTVSTQRTSYRPAHEREPPPRRALPSGPCNYRDASVGSCGCDQFWDKSSAELHDGSTLHRPASERVPWCVCGHHACYHLRAPRASEQATPAMHMGTKHLGQQVNVDEALSAHDERIQTSLYGSSQRHQRTAASEANGPGRVLQRRDAPTQVSSSGLPGLPSMCMLSNDRRPAAGDEARHAAIQPRGIVAGLGLSMLNMESMPNIDRLQSASPTIADDSVPPPHQRALTEPERASTRENSVPVDSIRLLSDLRGPFEQIKDFNRNLQADVAGDTIPNTLDPHDFIHSTTEVATPSIRGTPDLGAADSAVQQGKKLIDTLSRLASNKPGPGSSPKRLDDVTPVPGQQPNSPLLQQEEQLQNVLKSASPQDLQKLVSYLAPLHNLLSTIPNVAKTIWDLTYRLEVLENGSFNYVQPEDLHPTLEMYDDRLVTVENRLEEHEKMHQALADDNSSVSYSRRRIDNVTGSFSSNQSLQSTTSSALILAAMERKDKEAELSDIKGRLEMLESAAVPTTLNPWEVEVVLLPWGRELRGIWFSPDQPMHESSKTTTQDSEEWTQARNVKPAQSLQNLRDTGSSPNPGAKGIFSDTESGWSSQAISDWASGSTDDWLYPKACGANNLVYKRLLSRGFIRNVTLHSANARDIQATLSHAFSDVMEWLQFTDRDEDQMVAAHPALRASFIPLRKVMKESKLRFLAPSEMSSSAHWSAQFLAAGVVMRVSGGKRRLYVTQREAYVQRSDEMGSSWTWPELRQLPRFKPGQDEQMEGNDEQCQPVPEADAKETCWQYIATYDAPPVSVNSSFSSHQSVELSMRPADGQWRRSITPCSILKHRQQQPPSPISLFQQRPRSLSRTASTSVLEIPGSAKRRFNSSPTKHASSQPMHSRAPSISMARQKRRRVIDSSSPHELAAAPEMGPVTIWNPTPRRSREPSSPHITHPALPRSSSDVNSRPSQRSATRASNAAAFAYATPASGPFLGGPAFGGYNQGGDTEPDDDSGDDNENGEDADDDDDGEQSWHGVTDGDEISVSSSDSDANAGAQEMVSFSGDDSGFESENDASQSEGDRTPTARRRLDEDEDQSEDEDMHAEDDGVEILDHLLEVLEPRHECTLYECDSSC